MNTFLLQMNAQTYPAHALIHQRKPFTLGGACMCNTPKHKDPPMHARNADNIKDMVPTAGAHTV